MVDERKLFFIEEFQRTKIVKHKELSHIYGIYKNSTCESICKAEIETQMDRQRHGHQGEKGVDELGDWDWHRHATLYNIDDWGHAAKHGRKKKVQFVCRP